MLRRLSVAAMLAASCASAPALATGDPLGALDAMSKYNVITLGDWHAASDVRGRVLVLGNADGNTGEVANGLGSAIQHAVPGNPGDPALIIAGNNSIKNLAVNQGPNGNLGPVTDTGTVLIGGYQNGNINLNAAPRYLSVGGDFKGGSVNNLAGTRIGGSVTGGSLSGGTIAIGGSVSGGSASGTVSTGNAALAGTIQSDITGFTSGLADDIHALSDTLAGYGATSTATVYDQTLVLKAVLNEAGFAVIDLTQSEIDSAAQIAYDLSGIGSASLIVNFTGTSFDFAKNFVSSDGGQTYSVFSDVSQQVLWNFNDATSVTFGREFWGSVLAPDALVSNQNSAINGTVVAGTFQQGGEVHLGTFKPFSIPSVPEPASWAMMIGGLGMAGAALRRRGATQRTVRFA